MLKGFGAVTASLRYYAQNRATPTPPQIIARLLELFPRESNSIAVRTWAPKLPDEVNELLSTHGGLTKFASGHPNFFSVLQENGVAVVKLTDMSRNLRSQKKFKDEKRREKEADKANARRY